MANWIILKEAIASVIKTNDNQEITGQLLQNALNNIITNVGENATFAGIATPTTNPGTPDGPVFYIAATAGSYSNFGSLEVSKGETAILQWNNGTWTKNAIKSMAEFESGIIYDVSANNDGAVFESLSTLLGSANLSTLIPTSVRRGGMSIQFIQSSVSNSDNKYVQYRLTANEWSADTNDWLEDGGVTSESNKSKIGDKNDEYGVTTIDIRSDLLNGYEDEGNKGWRIEIAGSAQNLGPSSGYYKTNPHPLLSGDKITLVTNSGTSDTAVIATVKDGIYSTKVIGVGYQVTTYEYTALEDCDIVVSFYKNFTSAVLERGKTIVGILDEIRPQTGRVVYASEFGMDDQHDCADALEAAMNRMKNKGILVIDRDITVGRQVNVEGLFYCKIIGSQPGTRIIGTFSANTNTDPSILNLKCNGVSFENLHISYNVVSTTYKTRLVKIVPMTDGQSDLDVTFTNCTFEAFPSVPMSGVIAITAIGRGLKLDNCALLGQSNNGEPFIHITPRWNNLTTPFQDKPDNCRAVIITNCRIHNGSRGPIIYLNQDPYEPQAGFWGVVISNNYVDSVNFIVESNAKIRDLQITNNIFLEPDSFPLDGTLGGLVMLRDIDGLLISGNVFAALESYSISSVYSILLSPQSGFSVLKNIVITNNIFDGERNNCLIRCTNEVIGMGVIGLIISNNTFKDKCFGTSEDNHEGIINWSNCNWLNVAIIGNSYQGSSTVPAIKGVTTSGGNSWRCENIAIKGNVNIVNNIDYTQGENLTVINLDN